MPSDLRGHLSALVAFWRNSQRQAERVAKKKRERGGGVWETGVADDSRAKIGQLEDLLRGRGLPKGATYHAEGEAESVPSDTSDSPGSLPRFDPASDDPPGRWFYPNPPEDG